MEELKTIFVDESDYELLNIVSCITYDMNLHKILCENMLKEGNMFVLVNKDTNENTKLLVEEIEYLDGTFWLKVIQ